MGSTLRRGILIGYGIALALALIVLVWAVLNLVRLGWASSAILRENYRSILAAESMIGAIERQDSASLLVMLGYDDEGLAQFRENETQFLQWLGRAKDNITIDGETEIVDSIESGYSRYLIGFSGVRKMDASPESGRGDFYHETFFPLFQKVRDDVARLRKINQEAMVAASAQAEAVAQRAIWSTLVVAAFAIGAGLFYSLLLSDRLVRPIRQMMQATESLAGGDYDVHVPVGRADELGRLAEDFNAMAGKLKSYQRLNAERVVAETRKSDAVLRSIEDGVVVVDAELRVVNMNPQASRILGVEPVRGRHILEVVRDEQIFELIKQAVLTGRPPEIAEGKDIVSIGEGDAARHYDFDITSWASEDGSQLGAVLLLRDVTRLKELERMKSEFVMTASHELKTPLHSLGMSIDLLRESEPESMDARQRELLDAAHEEVARLKSLVTDLLDLSRIEAGKLELQIDAIPAGVLAEKAVAVLKTQAQENNLDLAATVPADAPRVRADANKITWVLTNLIANALRYARHRITVSAQKAGQWVHFSVIDDGKGIAPEDQSRIFEKFVQAKNEQSVGGTGLGLAICREIVRAHKGTIWVESTPGEGSTFTFTLPLADSHVKESPHGNQTSPHR